MGEGPGWAPPSGVGRCWPTRPSQTNRFDAGLLTIQDFWDSMARKVYWKTLRKETRRVSIFQKLLHCNSDLDDRGDRVGLARDAGGNRS